MLFAVGGTRFRTEHLLIIGILCISFSVSFLMRAQPAEYGLELHEFDPYFNYRATEFLLKNGIVEYFEWHDDMSWHPNGRNVSATSQVMLHLTAAAIYLVFGAGANIHDFIVVLPAVLGALTVVVVFALVRVIAGTTAGLLASMFFAMSLPIVLRGMIGWFKSEPLGLFYGLLASYLLLSGIQTNSKKIIMAKMLGGGVLLALGLASWGGIQFFVLIAGVFFLALPFLVEYRRMPMWGIPAFTAACLLTAMLFERPGSGFVFGLGGLSLMVSTIFFVACGLIHSKCGQKNATRNCLVLLVVLILLGAFVLVVNDESRFVQLPSFRYLNAINPFFAATNILTDSVSEHSAASIQESFFFHSIWMVFAGLGAWIMLSKKINTKSLPKDMMAFALIIGLAGVYVSSVFIRLEIFASISVIILASIGVSVLLREIFSNNFFKVQEHRLKNNTLKGSSLAVIVLLLLVPFWMPSQANWIMLTSPTYTILNGGTFYPGGTSDWKESLEWIKYNTPEGSVVAAWWDYGYWISTLSQRVTIADNATIDSTQIERLAEMFLSSPDEGWKILQEMDADYVLVFVAGERLATSGEPVYILGGGGDESKKQWFMRIAGEPLPKYLYSDGETPTAYFWNKTLLGQMFPFSTLGYMHLPSSMQSMTYVPGLSAVYVKDVKYPEDNYDGPFRLVYASSGYTEEKSGPMLGVFVYEVNHDYLVDGVSQ